nr:MULTISPECIES: Scr1 family TA system antitoxin-like transcriptional regulator [unclassified Streptomyces]
MRKLREQSGMSAQRAAALPGVDRTRIPHIESGRFDISPERVRTLAFDYGCPDTGLVDLLAAMAQERDRDRGWWEVPGILQTEEQARASFGTAAPPLPEPDLEARLALRLRRQEVLDRPVPYEAVIHEAALRMRFGGPKVAARSWSTSWSSPSGRPSQCGSPPSPPGVSPGPESRPAVRPRRYRGLLGRLRGLALSTADSRAFIRSTAQDP